MTTGPITAQPAQPARSPVRGPGVLSSVETTLPSEQRVELGDAEDLTVGTVVGGAVLLESAGEPQWCGPGGVFLLAWPGGHGTVTGHRARVAALTVPADALAHAAAPLRGDVARPLRFTAATPATPAAALQWTRAATFVRGVLLDDQVDLSPLVVASAARLLAATALAVFPHTLLGPDGSEDARATPRTLRRAEAFAHAHAHDDIGPVDLATAVSVTPRALQLAFQRHRGTTPTRFLRSVRLARAHLDLLAGDPRAGDTVTEIAVRWGFANPGRFAGYYGEAYGHPPRRTLDSRD